MTVVLCVVAYTIMGLCTVGVVDDEIIMMVSGVGLEQKKNEELDWSDLLTLVSFSGMG